MPLYAHPSPPETLVPHLQSHLPHSSPTLAPLLSTSAAQQPTAWASFPPSSDPPALPWLVLVLLPDGNNLGSLPDCRLYCSAEHVPHPAGDELVLRSLDEWKQMRRNTDKGETEWLFGGMNYQWDRTVPGVYRREELAGEGANTTVYVAPETRLGDTCGGTEGGREGVTFRAGQKGDETMVRAAIAEVTRPESYLTSRLPTLTVLLLSTASASESEPVAWVLTHADGSLGTLHTSPAHRRKGLARLVVQEHVRRNEGKRCFAFVTTGNVASEKVWAGLGWESWEVGWWLIR